MKYVLGLIGIAIAVVVGMQASQALTGQQKLSRWEDKCKSKEHAQVVSQDGKHICFFQEGGELRVSHFDPDR